MKQRRLVQSPSPAALCTPWQTVPGLPDPALHLSIGSGDGAMVCHPGAVQHMHNYGVSREENQLAKVPYPQEQDLTGVRREVKTCENLEFLKIPLQVPMCLGKRHSRES